MSSEMFNPVMFVSLGPGEPELITLKGLKILQQADMIYCAATKTENGKVLSRASDILLELGITENKIVPINIPMRKDRTEAMKRYKDISETISEEFAKGKKIAVTAEGDSGFYSSIHYINDNLKSLGVPVKRVAGVPAFIACGTLADLHIVKQEEELLIIPGITTCEYLKKNFATGKTIVIMKPSQCEDIIKSMLVDKSINFYYFENVGISDKEFYTQDREEIKSRKFPYFSLLIIRK